MEFTFSERLCRFFWILWFFILLKSSNVISMHFELFLRRFKASFGHSLVCKESLRVFITYIYCRLYKICREKTFLSKFILPFDPGQSPIFPLFNFFSWTGLFKQNTSPKINSLYVNKKTYFSNDCIILENHIL